MTEVARGRRGEGLQQTATGYTLDPGDRAAHAALLAALPAPPHSHNLFKQVHLPIAQPFLAARLVIYATPR